MDIVGTLKDIESRHNVKILFAVENGSRAWGIESNDSDWDIRFVYLRPLTDYLRLNKKQEVIEENIEPNLDLVGFDIYKFCRLLANSNPQCVEWLQSPILHYGIKPEALMALLPKLKLSSLFYHYKSLCKANYNKYIKSGADITYKRYLCCLRGMLNAGYIIANKELPPIVLKDILIKSPLNNSIKKCLIEKSKNKEKEKIARIQKWDDYIEGFLEVGEWTHDKDYSNNEEQLNEFLYGEVYE